MSRACQWLLGAFIVLYVAALALLAIGTFGLFGNERDPLAGVFLIPLGLPWNRMADAFPQPLHPWVAIVAPILNLAVILLACRGARAARS